MFVLCRDGNEGTDVEGPHGVLRYSIASPDRRQRNGLDDLQRQCKTKSAERCGPGACVPFHPPSGAFKPLAECFGLKGDEHVLSRFSLSFEQLLQSLVEGNNPFILLIQPSDPSATTFLRIRVEIG